MSKVTLATVLSLMLVLLLAGCGGDYNDKATEAKDAPEAGAAKQAGSEHPKGEHPKAEHPAGDHPDSAKAHGEQPKSDHPN